MEAYIYIIIFIMGAFIGSFASLAVYRIPIKEDILIKHSYCPNCKEKLVLKDLIPIFSYIYLKGKCSHCGKKIRARYLILELLSGLLFLLFFLSFNIDFYNFNINELITLGFTAIFFISLIIIAGIDKENKKIESSIIFFEIILTSIYVIYMCLLKLNVIYNMIFLIILIVLYIMDKFLVKDEENRYIIYFIILTLLTVNFSNLYIILFTTILSILTGTIHSRITKTEIPLAFYYIIYFISIFIGSNFII